MNELEEGLVDVFRCPIFIITPHVLVSINIAISCHSFPISTLCV